MKPGTPATPLLVRIGLLMLFLGSAGAEIRALSLVMVARQTSSQLFGLTVMPLLSITAWWAMANLFAWRSPSPVIISIGLVLTCGLGIGCKICSPTGHVSPGSHLVSVYKSSARFSFFSPAWLIDEADQVRLGGAVLPFLDPFMSREQGKNFAEIFNNSYAQLDQSSDFVQIGSTIGEAYSEMFLHTLPIGHAYIYRPSISIAQRCPVIVFLHGWLGNLKAYMWSWAKFADQHGFVIICPTFGNGRWKGTSADETLQWLNTIIRSDNSCDPDQVFVIGLSNGGTGVTGWATKLPNTYQGLVFISPVMDGTDAPEFAAAVGSRSVLVVHGGKDNRIPPAYVRQHVSSMTERGLCVRSICYADEDHVLILSSSDRLKTDLLAWMNIGKRETATPPYSLK
ncbi:MAG: prolyl oligopeptidase family serine peptidase [Candidatus Riflebacteria bacterium]|nr:prolyl oligopeptidase family serine peptidase [Candidatus Riflebacteria bacterium]